MTRRIVCGLACALTVSSLLMPSVSLAAEWIDVGGSTHSAADGAAGDGSTWSWDGGDDLQLNGYNGGAIKAEGKLNMTYSGNNTVTNNDDGNGILVTSGASENAELNIQGDASSTLNVTSSGDAIASDGDINIDGAGTVNATSTEFDAIDADDNLTIKGSGNVNATGKSDGIRADGDITIDNSGTVTAKATKDQGIEAGENLTIKGGGKVVASSVKDEALLADGNIEISGGSQVEANSEKDYAVKARGGLTVTNASLNATGVGYGVYAYEGITLDGATVTVRASAESDDVSALFTDEGDIVIKNGSIVDAFAEGEFSTAISTRNYYTNYAGGHIYISDSVVKAIARYAEASGDGPDHYSDDQDGETIPEREGLNIGIFAQTSEGITPATISIIRSKVTAEGDTAAIFALAMGADGKAIGTIEIEGATILTPEGGKVIDYRNKEELSDGVVYEAGQTIGTGDAVVDSPYDEAVAKRAVIAPSEETKPEDSKPDSKPEGTKTTKTVATATVGAKTVGKLAATGDTSSAAIVATTLAGTAAIAAGAVVSRKRSQRTARRTPERRKYRSLSMWKGPSELPLRRPRFLSQAALFLDVTPQCLDIRLAIARELRVLARDNTYLHVLVHIEQHGDNTLAVQLGRDNARANGIAIQTDYQVEQRGAVAHANVLGAVQGGENLLGEVKRIEVPLLVGEIGVVLQVVEGDAVATRQRVRRREKHMRLGAEKRRELQLVLAQHLLDHLAIARAQVQDAQLAFHVRDVLDDLVRLFLAQGKVVARGVKLPNHVDKRIDRKRVVLARDREVRHLARLATIALLE